LNTGWQTDWNETDYSGNALPWFAISSHAPDSIMEDSPNVGPSYNINYVSFHAISMVKCTQGRDKGKIYGTVSWGYYDYITGDIEVSGGGVGSF
jgi:hypothetical protein